MIRKEKYFLPTFAPTSVRLVVRVASFAINPTSGPPGTRVTASGSGYPPNDTVKLTFRSSAGVTTNLGNATSNGNGAFSRSVTIPAGSAAGSEKITARGTFVAVKITKTFTVN